MNTDLKNDHSKAMYLLLLAVQLIGAVFVMWNELPAFRQLLVSPGNQPAYSSYDELATIGTLLAMQAAYWYRLLKISIPFQGSNVVLNHLLLFFGRLSFIFGGALFSVVFFRHLPELDESIDIFLMARRGLIFVGTLFALFCVTLELERLGMRLAAIDTIE